VLRRVVPRYVPEIIADVPWTELVVTVNVILLLPPGTVAVAGTCAADVLLLVSRMTAPEGGAAPFSVNVAVDVEPPVTALGFKVSEIRDAAVTLSDVVFVLP